MYVWFCDLNIYIFFFKQQTRAFARAYNPVRVWDNYKSVEINYVHGYMYKCMFGFATLKI